MLIAFLVLQTADAQESGKVDSLARDEMIVELDETMTFNPKDPRKAAILSAITPGLGQIYNGKYWKVPLIYGTFGTMIYFADQNNKNYQDYLLRFSSFGLPGPTFFYDDETPDYILERYKDYYRRNRDLMYVGVGLFYILQIIDAAVDANMFFYDVGEDFSLLLHPTVQPAYASGLQSSMGLGLTFKF